MPFIGCDCPVCTSPDPRNQRLRCSLLLRDGDRNVLLDCGPDFRQQALRAGLRSLDAVVLTHQHADHIFGLDDLRLMIIRRESRRMPIYGEDEVLDAVRRIYNYAFGEHDSGSFRPRFELQRIASVSEPLDIAGFPLLPIRVLHSDVATLGFRIGNFAYVPDAKSIPTESAALLRGLDTLILDGLRPREHRTHLNIEAALATIAELQPRRAYLTHLTHEIDYAACSAELPNGVELAYDGLTVAIG